MFSRNFTVEEIASMIMEIEIDASLLATLTPPQQPAQPAGGRMLTFEEVDDIYEAWAEGPSELRSFQHAAKTLQEKYRAINLTVKPS